MRYLIIVLFLVGCHTTKPNIEPVVVEPQKVEDCDKYKPVGIKENNIILDIALHPEEYEDLNKCRGEFMGMKPIYEK